MDKRYRKLNQKLLDELLIVLKERRIDILNELINLDQGCFATSDQLWIIDEIIFRLSNIGSNLVEEINKKLKIRPLTKEKIEENLLNMCQHHYFSDTIEEDLAIEVRENVLNYFN